jgi:tRNA (guanine37-N1)-methyltransferase
MSITDKSNIDLSVILLHADMNDKQGKIVTTSLTMIDTHDIARSCKTFGTTNVYFAHPSPALRKLARKLQSHWKDGYGATYNPDRKEALNHMQLVSSLDEAIHQIDTRTGQLPILIATSALPGKIRTSFNSMHEIIRTENKPFLLMLGTGWGMSDKLLDRADYFLEPIAGREDYNHLSVRSACAIMLSRLMID